MKPIEEMTGLELREACAIEVMGWPSGQYIKISSLGGVPRLTRLNCREVGRYGDDVPAYESSIEAAFQVVAQVQKLHPGWRFSLLGGDWQMGYIEDSPSKGVNENKRVPFGWHAEFFGEEDPRKNYGDRHGTGWAMSQACAICRAALKAVRAK